MRYRSGTKILLSALLVSLLTAVGAKVEAKMGAKRCARECRWTTAHCGANHRPGRCNGPMIHRCNAVPAFSCGAPTSVTTTTTTTTNTTETSISETSTTETTSTTAIAPATTTTLADLTGQYDVSYQGGETCHEGSDPSSPPSDPRPSTYTGTADIVGPASDGTFTIALGATPYWKDQFCTGGLASLIPPDPDCPGCDYGLLAYCLPDGWYVQLGTSEIIVSDVSPVVGCVNSVYGFLTPAP
jgi:hypothetical protein